MRCSQARSGKLRQTACMAAVIAAAATLAACQSQRSSVTALTRNTLACRNEAAADQLITSGSAYQRTADGFMADGTCRLFQAGHPVTGRTARGHLVRFADASSGRLYWSAQ